MNPSLSTEEQVERLEALLKRVRLNAGALRQERAQAASGTASSDSGVKPISEAPHSPIPVTAPTGTLPPRYQRGTIPDFPGGREFDAAMAIAEGGAPNAATTPSRATLPPLALDELELPVDSLQGDLETMPPSRDDEFTDPATELTKPLWLGLNNGTGSFRQDSVEERPGDSHRTLAETPAAKVHDLPEAPGEEITHSLGGSDIDLSDSLETNPPISGHRPSSSSPEFEGAGEEFLVETDDLEQPLEVSAEFVEDPGSRISEAPPSVLGATITLPGEASGVALELAEAPPSSRHLGTAFTEDGLEADLPRTSFRAGYDESLSAPPGAIADLRARDLAELERVQERPVSISNAPQRLDVERVQDDDLPPVLSSRPARAPSRAPSVEYAPAPEVVPAVFEGTQPIARSTVFLELLDASLGINLRL